MPLYEVETADKRVFEVEAPTPEAADATVQEFLATRQPQGKGVGFLEAVKKTWQEPAPGGLIGIIKAPFVSDIPSVAPGLRREDVTDVPGSGQPVDAVVEHAQKMAPFTATGGVPTGSVGNLPLFRSGGAKPATGAAPAPKQAPPDVVETAGRIGVTIPRFIANEDRMTQGIAAGLKNVPGAGDKIAQAAQRTQDQLSSAAKRAQEGYGAGSPAVAGGAAKDALEGWISTGSGKIAERVYRQVDELVDPLIRTELRDTARAAQTILTRREASKIPGESLAVKTVVDAATVPGGMNYQGIKGLRSFLGEMTPDEIIAQGLKASEVKQIYSALTNDLRASVLNAGGKKALKAFNNANRTYEQIAARRQSLSRIIGTKGDAAPEAVFARILGMASSKSSADIRRLLQARKTMGPEAWNEVASAVLAKLGRDPTGDFSLKRFLGPNGYSGLSPAGKNVLFRSTGRDTHAQALDDIATVTKHIHDKLEQFANPSGTARSAAATAMVFGIMSEPVTALATIVGGRGIAKVLAEPASAQATATWLKAYKDALIAPSANASKKVKDAATKLANLIAKDSGMDAEQIAAQLLTGAVANLPAAGGG